jgi:hypothetical protein
MGLVSHQDDPDIAVKCPRGSQLKQILAWRHVKTESPRFGVLPVSGLIEPTFLSMDSSMSEH